jgi:hypothetical protein
MIEDGSEHMGHRLTAALTFLNAMGLFACIVLIAAATGKDAEIAVPLTRAVQFSVRMFAVGAVLPILAWGISAIEMNRTNASVKLIESWIIYFLLLVSLAMFVVASWRLPDAILIGLS